MDKTPGQLLGREGFTLIEILVALFLLTIVFVLIPTSNQDDSRKLAEQASDDISRTVNFAESEVVLRAAIVRMQIDVDKNGTTIYSVQAGPKGSFVLPKMDDKGVQTLKEQEENKKKSTSIDKQFGDVDEFKQSARAFPENLKFIGVGCNDDRELKISPPYHIYFYPNGDRDSCAMYFSSFSELIEINIPSVGSNIKVAYTDITKIDGGSEEEREEEIFNLAQAKYKEWAGKK
jgi:prepilin-type N-terminal cleavage/methylation domain-containing protein